MNGKWWGIKVWGLADDWPFTDDVKLVGAVAVVPQASGPPHRVVSDPPAVLIAVAVIGHVRGPVGVGGYPLAGRPHEMAFLRKILQSDPRASRWFDKITAVKHGLWWSTVIFAIQSRSVVFTLSHNRLFEWRLCDLQCKCYSQCHSDKKEEVTAKKLPWQHILIYILWYHVTTWHIVCDTCYNLTNMCYLLQPDIYMWNLSQSDIHTVILCHTLTYIPWYLSKPDKYVLPFSTPDIRCNNYLHVSCISCEFTNNNFVLKTYKRLEDCF